MTALLARVPRTAIRQSSHGLEEVELQQLIPGDIIVVRRGSLCPSMGVFRAMHCSTMRVDRRSHARQMPTRPASAEAVEPGNAGQTFTMIAERSAGESTYAGIVRLVERARLSKAPMTRLADRFAMVFLACTVALAGAAWILTGDPIRGLNAPAVATPCPDPRRSRGDRRWPLTDGKSRGAGTRWRHSRDDGDYSDHCTGQDRNADWRHTQARPCRAAPFGE